MITTSDSLKPVRYWLYCVALFVVAMVLVGGATRLTDSGLSITEWAPISGVIPPLSQADWDAAFAQYRTTTEFQTINRSMTLNEFKPIFWWEWGHRFLGRLIGLVYAIPFIWFWVSGRLDRRLKVGLSILFVLGGLQGFIGWWMVKSGLIGRVDVSQIRLAIHLTLASIIFALALWFARSTVAHSEAGVTRLSGQGTALIVLILVQIFWGGLVAGLDAGMVFNTWPLMNGSFVPEGWLAMSPLVINFFENANAVQFFHRCLAYALLVAAISHAISAHRTVPGSTHMRRSFLLAGLVFCQALVGIVTLLMQVPLFWALVHQLGALIVLAFAVAHRHGLNPQIVVAPPAKHAAGLVPGALIYDRT